MRRPFVAGVAVAALGLAWIGPAYGLAIIIADAGVTVQTQTGLLSEFNHGSARHGSVHAVETKCGSTPGFTPGTHCGDAEAGASLRGGSLSASAGVFGRAASTGLAQLYDTLIYHSIVDQTVNLDVVIDGSLSGNAFAFFSIGVNGPEFEPQPVTLRAIGDVYSLGHIDVRRDSRW